jgi:putative ABC transport system permease protein
VLSYVAKSLWRNPRRALAAIAGVALAVALFADAAFFVDGSAQRLTRRAIADVTIDMQGRVNTPLASTLALAASVSPRPPIAAGQQLTITMVATNTAPVDAHVVVLEAAPPPQLAYRLGSTTRDGVVVPDIPNPDDEAAPPTPTLANGLNLGTIAPGGNATVTYSATTRVPVPSAAGIVGSTIRSLEDPAPTPASGPKAVDLAALAAAVRKIPDVRVAQPFALVDLPARSVQAGDRFIEAPVKLIGIDPGYARDWPIVRFGRGGYAPGTAVLSPAAAEELGATSGSVLRLQIPGRPPTSALTVPVGSIGDFTRADQLFASREAGSIGDFLAAPLVVGVDIATFQSQVLPALRVDAAAVVPALKVPPILEVHAQVSRAALATDPGQAFRATSGVRRAIERASPGDVTVIDNVSVSLSRARTDSVLAKVLFVALGLPGAVLAGYLAFYGGGLLAETERRERALLRARGFGPTTLARGLAYQAIAIAGLGAAVGIGLAIVVADTMFSSEFTPSGRGFWISVALAAGVSALTTLLAVYLPARRALLASITEARQAVVNAGRPAWLRARLDIVLLVAGATVGAIFLLSGGFEPNPRAHDESVARSFYILLAPWFLWLGGALLAARGFLALSRRLSRTSGTEDFREHFVSRTLRLSVTRRPRAVASGIVVLSLAVAFGVSLAVFMATFRDEQRADARFVVGSDVRVTPSLGAALPADIDQRLRVPGVRDVSPVAQVGDAVVGTDPLLFAAIDPVTFEQVAPLNEGFFTDTTPRAAMRALERDHNALLVDKETATDFGFQKGDTVKVQLQSPVLGKPTLASLHVVGTFIQFPGFPLGLDLVGNLTNYQQATGATTPSYFLLRTDGDQHTNAAVTSVLTNSLGETIPARFNTTAETTSPDWTSLAGLSLTGLGRVEGLFTLLIASLAIVIFVVALLVQRNREHAAMRALGLGRQRLRSVVLGEPVFVLAVSVLVGIVISIPMAFMFVQVLRRIFIVPPDTLSFPPTEALLLAGLLVVTIALSAAIISAAIRRMRLVELLRGE